MATKRRCKYRVEVYKGDADGYGGKDLDESRCFSTKKAAENFASRAESQSTLLVDYTATVSKSRR